MPDDPATSLKGNLIMTTKLAARFITIAQGRREAGTSGTEYAGMLLVAAAIVVALVAAFNAVDWNSLISTAVSAVFGG